MKRAAHRVFVPPCLLCAALVATSPLEAQQGPGRAGEPPSRTQATAPLPEPTGAIAELTAEHEGLATFARALEASGLERSLSSTTQYTVFAPIDAAFRALGRAEELFAPDNREELRALLRAHIVADDVDRDFAARLRHALTLDGSTIDFSDRDGALTVGGATVVEPDFRHGNVRIYPIDKVLDRGERRPRPEPTRQRD